nr:MAG TPA: hypothetical protein [Bacteriophage sp.]
MLNSALALFLVPYFKKNGTKAYVSFQRTLF